MSLRISFELDDNDLKHFRLIMREARNAAARLAPEDVVADAEDLLRSMGEKETPGFMLERMQKLRQMIRMLSDVEWKLPHPETTRVLNALAYFAEPEDLIPDSIPGLGFLDDAIMIELVVRELKHEIEAYQDFCDFREHICADSGTNVSVSRGSWLEDRRKNLQSRMRRRHKKSRKQNTGNSLRRLLG